MLTDRRPILLANARVVDPSRDFDGPGDVLIADGTIRDSKRGIGAAGVPEGTDIINCAIPNAAEAVMLERDMRLVALTGGRYHAASLSSLESLEILKRARDAGLDVSASVSINHVTLNENDIGPYRTFLKLSPPLRTEEDRLALVAAVASGLVDVVMSDHNPQDVEVKRLPFAEAAAGAVGLQTMLPAALRLIHNGEMSFKTLIRAMSTRPAELLGLPGGTLRAGSPADVVVIDPDTPWVLDPADLKSQCKNTPFDEARFSGRVVRTIVSGRTVYEHV
jgi:dihydroorotase